MASEILGTVDAYSLDCLRVWRATWLHHKRAVRAMRLETQTVKRIDVKDGPRYLQPQAKCPQCKTWADVDEEQLTGTVSLVCEICDWHGYIDGRTA